MSDPTIRWQAFLSDLIILSIGGIALLIFFVGVTPTRRGFYCNDESIQYPFHESTIPNWALYIYTFSIPIIVISLTEYFTHRRSRPTGIFMSRPVPLWVPHFYRSLVDFILGCVGSQLVTDVGKYTIGRLRPNFIAVCKPNVTCNVYDTHYIQDYVCQNSPDDAKESRVSFPSGHSSFSAYTMLYIAIYIQVRWNVFNRSHLRLVKTAVQIILILIAYFTALSRVMDNKHHWSDVLAGGLIGSIAAALTARYVSTIGTGRQYSEEKVAPANISINNSNSNTVPDARERISHYDLEAQDPNPKDQPGIS